MSLLSNPWVHTLKERQNFISYLLHTLSRKPKTQEAISLFHTHGPTPKERKDSLKLSASHTRVQPPGKGNLFMQEWFYSYFPLKNHKFGKGFSYSHLRIHDFFKEFLVMVIVVCEIRKSWTCKFIYIYIYAVLRSFETVLVIYWR